jgi:outer membrane murein-binding lipoprotein Lpp
LLKPIVGAFFLAPLRLAGCGSKRSDAELISHFQAHRQEIDTLRQKMQAEQVVTRLSNFGADSSNLPVDSVEKYRRMFHNIDPTMFDGIEQVHGFYFDPDVPPP